MKVLFDLGLIAMEAELLTVLVFIWAVAIMGLLSFALVKGV